MSYLVNKVFDNIIDGLTDNTNIFDNFFGKSERLIKVYENKNYYYPAYYRGGNEYISLLPDSGLGNYLFFTLAEPQEIDSAPLKVTEKATFSIVAWFDMRTILSDNDSRNVEKVKRDLLHALNDIKVLNGFFFVNRVYEKAENIFDGYSLKEVDNQFLMSPYAGLRFECYCEISDYKNCVQ